MANKKISALTSGSPAQSSDQYPIARSGANFSLTNSNISTFAASDTQILTNKTLDTAGTGNVLKINGTTVSAVTGTGSVVLGTSPTIVTPTIASFTNATHNHQNAAGGGTLDLTAIGAATILPPANGGAANVTVADQGYFFGGFPWGLTTVTNAVLGSTNTARAIQFVLPFRIVITRITWNVAAGAGDTVSFGIYSADRTTLLVNSGATVSSGTSTQTVTIASATLNPGTYWFAYTQAGTTTTFVNWNNANRDLYLNGNAVKKVGTGTATSGGALNASLGTISAATITSFPVVVFEP